MVGRDEREWGEGWSGAEHTGLRCMLPVCNATSHSPSSLPSPPPHPPACRATCTEQPHPPRARWAAAAPPTLFCLLACRALPPPRPPRARSPILSLASRRLESAPFPATHPLISSRRLSLPEFCLKGEHSSPTVTQQMKRPPPPPLLSPSGRKGRREREGGVGRKDRREERKERGGREAGEKVHLEEGGEGRGRKDPQYLKVSHTDAGITARRRGAGPRVKGKCTGSGEWRLSFQAGRSQREGRGTAGGGGMQGGGAVIGAARAEGCGERTARGRGTSRHAHQGQARYDHLMAGSTPTTEVGTIADRRRRRGRASGCSSPPRFVAR